MPAYADPAAVDAPGSAGSPHSRTRRPPRGSLKQLTVAVLGGRSAAGGPRRPGPPDLPAAARHASDSRAQPRGARNRRGASVVLPRLAAAGRDARRCSHRACERRQHGLAQHRTPARDAGRRRRSLRGAAAMGQRASATDPVSPLAARVDGEWRGACCRARCRWCCTCSPHMKRCDGLYANATRAYAGRVLDVSLTGVALRNVTWNRGVHPNVIAHFLIAEGVARRSSTPKAPWSQRPTRCRCRRRNSSIRSGRARRAVALPPCDRQSCAGPDEFNLRRCAPAALSTTATSTSCGAQPHAAADLVPRDEARVDEHDGGRRGRLDVGGGPARILVAMCSYAPVGRDRDRCQRAAAAAVASLPGLCWQSRSSQQCLVSAGTVGPGRHTLTPIRAG